MSLHPESAMPTPTANRGLDYVEPRSASVSRGASDRMLGEVYAAPSSDSRTGGGSNEAPTQTPGEIASLRAAERPLPSVTVVNGDSAMGARSIGNYLRAREQEGRQTAGEAVRLNGVGTHRDSRVAGRDAVHDHDHEHGHDHGHAPRALIEAERRKIQDRQVASQQVTEGAVRTPDPTVDTFRSRLQQPSQGELSRGPEKIQGRLLEGPTANAPGTVTGEQGESIHQKQQRVEQQQRVVNDTTALTPEQQKEQRLSTAKAALSSREATAEQKLAAIESLHRELPKDSRGRAEFSMNDNGQERKFSIERAQIGRTNSHFIHMYGQGSDGREHIAMRGISRGEGQYEHQKGRNGSQVSFTGNWWGANNPDSGLSRMSGQPESPSSGRRQSPERQQPERQPPRVRQQPPEASTPRIRRPERHAHTHDHTHEHSPGARVESERLTPEQREINAQHRLKPVTDPKILRQVPDATYIGESGKIRYKENGQWVVKHDEQYWLPRRAAEAFVRTQDQLAERGKRINLVNDHNPAGRTHAQQESARAHARVAARVGSSNHENPNRGAIDISNHNDRDVKAALLSNGFRWGDSRGPIANDPFHFSFQGGDNSNSTRYATGRHRGRRR